MGLFFRLGLMFLGIGTWLMIGKDVCLCGSAFFEAFPRLGEQVLSELVALLILLLLEPLAEEIRKVPQALSQCLQVACMAIGVILTWLGLIGGFVYCFLRNRKAKL